jgi:hypothetical protein
MLMVGISFKKLIFEAIELGAGGGSGCDAQPASRTGINPKMRQTLNKAFLFISFSQVT